MRFQTRKGLTFFVETGKIKGACAHYGKRRQKHVGVSAIHGRTGKKNKGRGRAHGAPAKLGEEPVGKLLFRLSVPTIAAQLVNALYNIVDRMYIGHMEGSGKLALTAMGVCLSLIMIISAFAALTAMGGAARASIMLGKGDKKEAERILGNCTIVTVIVGAVLTVVFVVFAEKLLWMFGADEDTIGYAVQYMRIYAFGTIFVELALGLNAFITAQGFSLMGMLSVVIGAVVNIALDPLLIYGFSMGVRGAAIATVVSQTVSAVWVVGFLLSKKTILRIRLKYFKVSWASYLPCVFLGASPFIMQFTESVISICFNVSLLKYGGTLAVGAMTILYSVMQFAMLPLQGLTQGAQPIVSYNYGAGQRERVKKTFGILLRSCLIYSTGAVGDVHAFPAAVCQNVYFGRGARRVRLDSPARLYGHVPHLRRADRLPADVYRAGKSGDFLLPRGTAQSDFVDSAHFYSAAYFFRR